MSDPQYLLGIKEELDKLLGDALYNRVSELIDNGNLTREDWHTIDFQKNVYEKLMAEKFDIVKIKTLNAKWKASIGIQGEEEKAVGKEDDRETYNTRSGFNIYPFQFTRINLAWAIINDELWILHPLTYKQQKTVKTKDREATFEIDDIANFVITSSRDAFLPRDAELRKARVTAHIPDTILEPRWSVNSILKHLKGESNVNPFAVYKSVKKPWEYYIDVDNIPGAYTISALWDIYTYFFPLFNYTPYKWYTGKTKTAKSKTGTLDSLIAFNGFSSVDQTGPNLFRAIQETLGTMHIDEYEKSGHNRNKSEKQADVEAIINAGFEANIKVSRLEKQGNKQVRILYDVFSPKVISGIAQVTETLENRSYKFPMLRTRDRKKSRRELDRTNPEWQETRDALYTLLMNYWKEVQEIAKGEIENRLDLSEREWNKAKPLLVIAQFVAKYAGEERNSILDDVWAFLKFQLDLQKEQDVDSWDYSIIKCIEGIIKVPPDPLDRQRNEDDVIEIRLTELSEQVAMAEGIDPAKINKTQYGRSLRREIERLGIGHNFHRGTGNALLFDTSQAIIKSTKERYFPNDSVQNDNSGNSDNYDNYTNYGNSKQPDSKLPSDMAKLPLKPDDNSNDNSLKDKKNSGSPDSELSKLSFVPEETPREMVTDDPTPQSKPANSAVRSEKPPDMDQVDSKLCRILQDDSGKKVSVNQLSQKWSIVTEPKEIPALAEIYSRMIQLAGKHPNVRMANDRFYWEES